MNAPKGRNALAPDSRYELLVKIASGGMATVYVARLRAGQGVSRLVAVKRAHPHLAEDPQFRRMLLAEARLGAQIHHANVVAVQDVEELDGELLVVMDYVEGAALSELLPLSDDPRLCIALAVRVVLDAAAGLHAAHELKDDQDQPLAIVHRDISPHNMLVGLDGVTRVTDFGIAKSRHASVVTSTGAVRGKLAYMAPEYLTTGIGDRRIDVFALGVVLWEALTGERLFKAATEQELVQLVERCELSAPSTVDPYVPAEIDAVVMSALERDPARRFATAADFRDALEGAARTAGMLATHAEVAAMVAELRREPLAARRAAIRASGDAGSLAAEPTATFSREVERRDAEPTASLAHPIAAIDAPTVAERPSLRPQPPAPAPIRVQRESLLRSRVLPLVAGAVIAGTIVAGWRLSRPKVEAPPVIAAVSATETTSAPSPPILFLPPPALAPSAVVAPVSSAKRPRQRPAHPAPQPSSDVVIAPIVPASDHSKPNPYHDAGT